MTLFPFLRKTVLFAMMVLSLAATTTLKAQTAMPNCEGLFDMYRIAGVDQIYLLDNDTVCAGIEVFFSDQSTSPNGPIVSWEWSINGTEVFAQTASYVFIQEGTYVITLSANDGNNCFVDVDHTLKVIAPPTFEYAVSSPLCFGGCDGTATVLLTSGNAPTYNATWDDPLGQGGFDAYFLCAGMYAATLTDDYGCIATSAAGLEASVTDPPQLVVEMFTDQPSYMCPGNGAQWSINITGGTGTVSNYIVDWSPQSGLDNPNSGAPFFTADGFNLNTTYTATVTDDNGCQASDDLEVLLTTSGIEGVVTMGSLIGDPCVDCEVVMYIFDPLPGVWTEYWSGMTNAGGGYVIVDVPGLTDFVMMARPNQSLYPGCMPTYYLGNEEYSHMWNDAAETPMNTGCASLIQKDIAIIESAVLDGTCTITGGVYGETGGKTLAMEPIPLIDVVVERVPPGNAISTVVTDNPTGLYEFHGLPILEDGEVYEFYVNIPGVPGAFGYQIAVVGPDLLFEHIDFCVNIDTTAIEACTVLGVQRPEEDIDSELVVYPSPTNSQFSISLGKLKGENATIEVLDMTGRKVWERAMTSLPNLVLVSGVAAGNYVVRVTTLSEVHTAKLSITGE